MTATLPWIIALLATAAAAALGVLLHRRRPKAEEALPNEWSLTPRPVFNEHERRVHRQLREALPQQVILAKLPLVRFCQPTDPTQVRFWFDLLGATHVSFAVCSASGRVLAAVDLDDGRAPTRRSTLIKQAVLAACHVRYVRYAPEQTPSVPELQLLVPASATPPVAPPITGAVVRTGFSPAVVNVDAFRQRTQPARGLTAGRYHRDSSSFGRDSVISGFSHSLPSVMPEREGEVVDAPPTRH
jgi:hypothetical protein